MSKAYWFFRYILLGPLLKSVFRVKVVGLEHVPATGGVILASNHQAVIDSFVIPALIDRPVTFLAKAEYFTQPGLLGRIKRAFFSIAAVPVYRDDSRRSTQMSDAMTEVLEGGGVIGIHPEGTRAPDEHVYRGRRGVIQMAWRTGVPVVPIALLGTRRANPPGRRMPRIGTTITVVFGEPMLFEKNQLRLPGADTLAQAAQAKLLMQRIAELAGWQYVNTDARKAKEAADT